MFLRDLPEEILLKISADLNNQAQAKLAQTNHFFKQLQTNSALTLFKEKPRSLQIGECLLVLKAHIYLSKENKMRYELSVLDNKGNKVEEVLFSSHDRFEKILNYMDQKNIKELLIILNNFEIGDEIQAQWDLFNQAHLEKSIKQESLTKTSP